MNTEDKVTSIELSKQLKEAGAKQKSEHAYNESGTALVDPVFEGGVCAFDCAELFLRLPLFDDFPVRLQSYAGTEDIKEKYRAGSHGLRRSHHATTPAEALGKLYLWCLKEGHCSE